MHIIIVLRSLAKRAKYNARVELVADNYVGVLKLRFIVL